MHTSRTSVRRGLPGLGLVLASLAFVTSSCGQHNGRQGLPPPDEIVLTAPVEVPMELAGGRPVVSVRINGHGPYKLILDSGAAGSVFSEVLAEELGFPKLGRAKMARPGSKESQPATLTKVEKIEIDGLALTGVSAVYADLSVLKTRLGIDVAGVLSATMLEGLLVTYDYPAAKIGFRRGILPAADGETLFDWPAGERLPSVPITVAGQSVRVDIDTGSGGGFTIPQSVTTGLAWIEAPVAVESITTLDRQTPAATGRLRGGIVIGKFVFTEPVVRTNDGVLRLVGYQVLKDFVFTLDAKNRRFELRKP